MMTLSQDESGKPIVGDEMDGHTVEQLNNFYGVDGFVRRRRGESGAGLDEGLEDEQGSDGSDFEDGREDEDEESRDDPGGNGRATQESLYISPNNLNENHEIDESSNSSGELLYSLSLDCNKRPMQITIESAELSLRSYDTAQSPLQKQSHRLTI